jgi:ABC-2 type transport system ATP-binding protein
MMGLVTTTAPAAPKPVSARATEPVVVVEKLSRRFGARTALHEVDLVLERGAVLGLVGKNGAGKTTLVQHLLGLLRAQSGSVRVFGLDPVADPAGVLGRVGYLSEDRTLPGWMTVAELMRYTAAFYPRWDPGYAARLCDDFRLDPAQKIRTLSRGQHARAALATALAHRPELLVLDEPSSGLDPVVRRDVLEAILHTVAEEGRTVLFSSHLLDEVERMSDHLALIEGGRILLSGGLEQIRGRHWRITGRANGRPSRASERPEPLAVTGVLAVRADGSEATLTCDGERGAVEAELRRAGYECLSCSPASLDEIFFARTSGERTSGGTGADAA